MATSACSSTADYHEESAALDLSSSKSPSVASDSGEAHSPARHTPTSFSDSSPANNYFNQHTPVSAASIIDPKLGLNFMNPLSLLQGGGTLYPGGLDPLGSMAGVLPTSAAGMGLYGAESGLPSLTTAPWGMYLNHLSSRKRKKASSNKSEPDTKVCKDSLQSGDNSEAEKKDESYRDRRRKNNEAAKRSRDARRQKEEEIAMRAAFLEQENLKLRAQVAILKNESAKLHFLLYNRTNNVKSPNAVSS